MLKAVTRDNDGNILLVLGLSFGNLDHMKKRPMDSFVKVKGEEVGLPGITILIAVGETEQAMMDALVHLIGPSTEVRDDRDGRPAEQPAVKGGPRNV